MYHMTLKIVKIITLLLWPVICREYGHLNVRWILNHITRQIYRYLKKEYWTLKKEDEISWSSLNKGIRKHYFSLLLPYSSRVLHPKEHQSNHDSIVKMFFKFLETHHDSFLNILLD